MIDELEKLLAGALALSKVKAEVGIFSDHATRSDGKSNLELGWEHEMGAGGLPARSFLQAPAGAFRPSPDVGAAVASVLDGQPVEVAAKALGEEFSAVVQSAFDHEGFPTAWEALSPRTINRRLERGEYLRAPDTILTETGQLAESISVRVK